MAQAPKRKRTSNVPQNETPDAKFLRLAGYRAGKAIYAIKTLEPLASPRVYSYTDVQVNAMLQALRKAVDTLENKFKAPAKGEPAKPDTPFLNLTNV